MNQFKITLSNLSTYDDAKRFRYVGLSGRVIFSDILTWVITYSIEKKIGTFTNIVNMDL